MTARHGRAVLGACAAVTLLAAACDEDIVAPERGALAVTISGLPTGENASVAVTGPGGFSRDLTATTTIDDLLPGDYTIAAVNVERADGRWGPTPATQTVVVPAGSGATPASVTYAVVTARLAVTITGLPNGVNASVTVTGPNGYTNTLTSSAALEFLAPGAYTITAADIVSGDATYRAAPATQTVQLTASTTQVAANVVYAEGTGALTVTISGLSGGAIGAVQVTGPGGYTQQITASQTLQPVPPGTYTIAASAVASSLTTHTPSPATQDVSVAVGATATATVTYAGTPLDLGLQPIVEGIENPVYLAAPVGDARLFIVEQRGRIRIFKNGALLPTPFLDITSIVRVGGEEGLLSVAFDPAYATNGRFYVYYTNTSGNISVARYTAPPAGDVADANSRSEVITIPHPTYANHNGGLAMFGPDGMLYLGTGDGGSGGDPDNNGQNINSLLGKLLRLDVTSLPYTNPPDNPFAGATPGRDEIWAYGLRNPWRYAFDPPSEMLYIADVGQESWEEVNAVADADGGVNYGWRIMEGTHCYNAASCNGAGLTVPVYEYSHASGCSITGGFVYRGAAIPELAGHYLFSDFCSGFLRSFRLSANTATEHRDWGIGFIGNTMSFGLDGAGELYMLFGGPNGRVFRVVKQ
ncbi:MAG: PQQ-dependent sugar dehydrogenase [Gemmatimonadaceae bacterium]